MGNIQNSKFESVIFHHDLLGTLYTVARPPVSQNLVTLGPKGKTGFTEETDRQPFTFQDRESCAVSIVSGAAR